MRITRVLGMMVAIVLLASMAQAHHSTPRPTPSPTLMPLPTATPSLGQLELQVHEMLRTWRNWILVEDGSCGPYWRARIPAGGAANLGSQECRFRGDYGGTLWHPFGQDIFTAGAFVNRRTHVVIGFFFRDQDGTLYLGRNAKATNVMVDESGTITSFRLVLLDENDQPNHTPWTFHPSVQP